MTNLERIFSGQMGRKRSIETSLETCTDQSVEEPRRSKRCLSIPFLLSAPATASKCFVCWDDCPNQSTSSSTSTSQIIQFFSCWYCSTTICATCLENYATASGNDRALLPLRCVQGNCRAPIPPPVLRDALPNHQFNQLMRSYTQLYGNGNEEQSATVGRQPRGRHRLADIINNETRRTTGNQPQPQQQQQQQQQHESNTITVDSNSNNTDDKGIEQLMEANGWRRCPQCGVCVERTTGCNHIVCVCGGEFCYQCGERWHIAGLGCQCRNTGANANGNNNITRHAPLAAALTTFDELCDEFWLRIVVLFRSVRENCVDINQMNRLFVTPPRPLLPPCHAVAVGQMFRAMQQPNHIRRTAGLSELLGQSLPFEPSSITSASSLSFVLNPADVSGTNTPSARNSPSPFDVDNDR